ncbi:MAG: DDE-type integrase/transposase/recombinase [Firmicutes bacterium]|jgi:hypothetical protein|nr:DDE-type integrase/transposase/recombinase [Bacillota bacterium]
MEDNKKEEMALFRYSLIAPLVAGTYTEGSKAEYYRNIAGKEYVLPDGTTTTFSASTIKKWYIMYGKEKLQALITKERSDIGKSRTLTEEMCLAIDALKEQFPHITGVKIYEKLVENGIVKQSEVSIDSVYRYLRSTNQNQGGMPPKETVAFEYEHANDCWQADSTDGPYINIDGRPVQTYLISFIDDASRLIVHGEFYLSDNEINMQDAFKKAIMTYGLPRRIFTDNGGSYKNSQISYICAQLGIVEIHSTPYYPKGKGKSERSHRTAHQKWMDCTDFSQFHSLEELNESYWEFLNKDYNNRRHSSIGMTPKERYLKDFELIRFVEEGVLEEAFLHRVIRKVSGTACISLYGTVYETEQKYIGKKVSVRYKPEDRSCIYIYDGKTGIRLNTAYPVKKIDNAKRSRRANISYGKMDGGGSDV